MKSRQASPQPEVVRMRAFRLGASAAPPMLHLANGTSPTISFSSIDHQSSPSPSRPHPNYANNMASYRGEDSHNTTDLAMASTTSPHRLVMHSIHNADAVPGDTGEPWSSAVGRATTGGKSGRVIERLQADVDRLKRELNAATLKTEEETRRADLEKYGRDSAQASYQNLEAICNANESAMLRKDRKIEDLKVSVREEKSKREAAERVVKETLQHTNRALGVAHEDVRREKEIGAQATNQYDLLSSQTWREKLECQKHMVRLSSELSTTQQMVKEANERCRKLEAICEQNKQGYERSDQLNRQLRDSYEEYKTASEHELAKFREGAALAGKRLKIAEDEMISTARSMKWFLNVKRDFKGEFKEGDWAMGNNEPRDGHE